MLLAFAITALAGAATIVGGVIGAQRKVTEGPALAVALAFAAGAMVTVSVLEIIPKGVSSLRGSFSQTQAVALTIGLVIVGAAAVFIGQRLAPHVVGVPDALVTADPGGHTLPPRHRLHTSGLIVALAVAGHNLPEGLATFVTVMTEPIAGLTLAVAVAIHNVPEGIAIAAPVYAATRSRRAALTYASVAGLAEPLGGLVGYWAVSAVLPGAAFGLVFGLIAGMMCQIGVAELLPTAYRLCGRGPVLAGALAGGGVMVFSVVLLRSV